MTSDKDGEVWRRLVRLAKQGSLPAFDALVHRFRPAVYTVCCRAVGRDGAEDATQAVFVLAYLHLGDLRNPDLFPAWLYSIARNQAGRTESRDATNQDLENLVVLASQALSNRQWTKVDDRICRQPIWEALLSLPEHLSVPAQLVYGQEWSVHQTAEFLGLTPTTVKWRLHEARQALRRAFPDLAPQTP